MANEEEYHIPEEDQPLSTPEMPTIELPKKKKVGMKVIIIPILILLAIWISYRLFHSVMHARRTQNITTVTQAPQPITPQPFANQAPPQPQVSKATVPMTAATAAVGLDNRLANIEEGNAESQAKIERTNANLAEVQNALTTMTSQLTALNNTIQDLASQVAQQQKQIQSLMTQAVERKRMHGRAASSEPKRRTYYIQAMIPGRAWIYSGDRLLTIRVGDSIPGYGQVTEINTNLNVVNTSSGDVIGFESGEN